MYIKKKFTPAPSRAKQSIGIMRSDTLTYHETRILIASFSFYASPPLISIKYELLTVSKNKHTVLAWVSGTRNFVGHLCLRGRRRLVDWRQKVSKKTQKTVMYITHARRLFVLSLQFRAKGKVLERKKKYKKIYIKRRDEGKSYKVKKKKRNWREKIERKQRSSAWW